MSRPDAWPAAWSVRIIIGLPCRLQACFAILAETAPAQAQAASFADLRWWQVFQDPQLQELIRTALKENYDLQLATERISAARAQVTITRSSLFPQVQAGANFTGGKDPTSQATYNILALTADAAFQLDLFGRLRRATEASRAQLLATEDARDTVILTLVSDVASDYFTLLELYLELQITRDTVKTQEDSVKLTRLRLDHGVATKLDVLQAQQVLDTANAAGAGPGAADRPGGRRDQYSPRPLSRERAPWTPVGPAAASSGSAAGTAVDFARAAAGHSPGGTRSDHRQRRDRRRQGCVFPADFAYRLGRRRVRAQHSASPAS